ncbi:MAG: hypothetical protein ACREQ2_13930 [Candidatus Binatia bacterium]
MDDRRVITESYKDLIKTVFSQFYQASILAKTPQDKAKAEQIFRTGITFARQVRDRAVAILPPA